MFGVFSTSQPQNSIDRGREALKYFHNQASRYPGYKLTFNALIDTLGTARQSPIQLEGIGETVISLELSTGQVQDAMESLADQGQGRVPATPTVYFQALGNKKQEFSFIDATSEVAPEVAGNILKRVENVGTAALDTVDNATAVISNTVKSLGVVLPIALVGAVLFIIYAQTKRVS